MRNFYEEGKQAYYDGLDYIDCPSTLSRRDYDDWCEGWLDARGETKLYDFDE